MTYMYTVWNIQNVALAVRTSSEKSGLKSPNGEYQCTIGNPDFTDDIYSFNGSDLVHFERKHSDGSSTLVYNYKTDGASYSTTFDEDNDGIPEYMSSHTVTSHSESDYYYDGGRSESTHKEYRDDGLLFFERHMEMNEKDKSPSVSYVESYEYDEQGRLIQKKFDNEKNNGKSFFGKLIGFFAPKDYKDAIYTYTYNDKTNTVKERVKYGYFN